ncbi:Glycosyltransferase involved in cell wall bisynthesis [Ferrimonas sediminum]|uniref:Glycosyltransferase involved in cell wall bisynthesis n=1 Tax=Ferrimonas sediminum TaxID=718193 RepID=A0A1G8S7K5_9GAMM|nr:glycosyltransferase [Ferrimonas sediminum]SDJ25202.1 Glycosyltransferase involved in cell wall bisynthesis [Ferrimonas sediminum]
MTPTLAVKLVIDGRHFGGIEAHLCLLYQRLHQQRVPCQLVLLSAYSESSFKTQLKLQKIPFIELKGSWLSKLRQLAALSHHSVLHSHGYKANVLTRLACRLSGTRPVATFHAGEPGQGRLAWYNRLDKGSARFSLNVAVSRAIAERVPGPCPVIRNFVSLAATEARTPSSCLRVGFIGRYCRDKGFDRFCRLSQQLPQYQWHSFGQGPLSGHIDGNAIIDHGHVHDIGRHLANLDLLVMPSRFEGLPLAALEAMAAELPIIAYDVGDLTQLVNHQVGALIDAGNHRAMIEAIEHFATLNHQQRQHLGQQARARVEREWNGQATLATYLSLYRQAGQFTPAARPAFFDRWLKG